MSKIEFAHLHAHSDYSLLDGMARFTDDKGKPTPMLEDLARVGFTHQALTDHGNMFGAIEFYKASQKAGVIPVLGCELYVAVGSMHDRKAVPGKEDENPQKSGINHLTVLAKDNEGYQNLIELVTRASLEGFYYKPRVDKELLAKHSKGLVGLSGCLKGEVAQAITLDNMPLAIERANTLADIFGRDNFFLEVMDHGLEAQKKVVNGILEIARHTKFEIVATNDCHYFKKDEADAHDALLCIGTGKKLSDSQRMRYASREFYYKSPEEMEKVFGQNPEFMMNAARVARLCGNVKISFNELHLPDYNVPQGHTQASYLEFLCLEGLNRKFPSGATREYQERLESEMGIIKRMGFPGYFLIVWDFVNFAKRNGIPVGPGRGSGAGSIVSYLLSITDVDPIRYRLLFERFLNPDRRTMPDLDIDFSDEGREAVIKYVRDKYGFTNVAQIVTFGTLQSRAVIRDVGRVLDVPLSEVDKIAKNVPQGMTLAEALKNSPEFKQVVEQSQSAKKILPIAIKLEGARRHTGVHAAGTVITREPVTKYAPLYKSAKSDVTTTGFNDECLNALGLLKVDFLGLRTLSVIQKAMEMAEEHRGVKIVWDEIGYDDPKTYELLCRGQAVGVFQLESRGMRDLLLKLKPAQLTEIIALIALYRPGPMKWIDEYCARKHGQTPVKYEHPLLESILKESYGICVYQEQVMEIAKQMAGFSAGEADRLRAAMGKKKIEELEKMEVKFIEGAKAKSVDERLARKIYNDLKDFGRYAFNKSHSAAYGVIAYRTAYLKANYPIEFMTSLAMSEIGRTAVGSDDKENKVATYLEEARTMGFATVPPCANYSRERFTIEGNKIRFGLLAIKNVGDGPAGAIVKERMAAGPYKSIEDMFMRLNRDILNKKVLESLVKAGALDDILQGATIVEKRGRFILNIDFYLEFLANREDNLLFDVGIILPQRDVVLPSEEEVLRWEREILGMYLTLHPLHRWRGFAEAGKLSTIADVRAGQSGRIETLGLVSAVRKQVSKKTGMAWARVKIEDLTGLIETMIFPKTYASINQELLKPGQLVVVTGRVNKALGSDEDMNSESTANATEDEILVEEIRSLEDFVAARVTHFYLILPADRGVWTQVRRALQGAPSGAIVIGLAQGLPDTAAKSLIWVEYPMTVGIDKSLWQSLELLIGADNMVLTCKAPSEFQRRYYAPRPAMAVV
ncbi:MAG: DNA polymerase III subunit alpha [Elusimicrobia bacterium]|nr:DNA polymerase III subunit alpha [Elusimicrobiota bacterium]